MLKKIAIFFTFFLLFFVIRYNALDTVDYSGLMQPLDTDYWIAGSIVYAKKHGFFANHCFNTRFINKSLSNNQNKKNTVEYYENNDTSIFEANGYWKVYRSKHAYFKINKRFPLDCCFITYFILDFS